MMWLFTHTVGVRYFCTIEESEKKSRITSGAGASLCFDTESCKHKESSEKPYIIHQTATEQEDVTYVVLKQSKEKLYALLLMLLPLMSA